MDIVDKGSLRREFLRRRRLLSRDEVDARSAQILHHIDDFATSHPELKIYHSFLPIDRNKEVNTWPIVNRLVANGRDVLISTTDFESHTMHHFHYEADLEFSTDRLGIPSPVNARPAELSKCHCVFLPLVVADKKGGRIGYGGGYYDRLLEETHHVVKVGLSMGPCVDEITFLEPHDVRLDYCITPTETIDCRHG